MKRAYLQGHDESNQGSVSRFAVLLALMAATVGCAGPKAIPEVSYEYRLSSVDLRSEENWDRYTVSTEDTTGGQILGYQDERIGAGFIVGTNAIKARFSNLSSNIQRVQLQEGLFIGADGSAQELVTGDMSYANRNASPRPVILRPGDSKVTTLIPRQHINFSEDLGIVYTEQLHIYPDQIKSLSMAKQARAVVGNTLQLVLPVRSRGNVRQYRFRFSVSEAQLPSDYAIRAMLNGEVSEGLRMEYVRKIKGDPKEIKEEQGRTIWYYGTVTDWTKIVFDDGKVVDVR